MINRKFKCMIVVVLSMAIILSTSVVSFAQDTQKNDRNNTNSVVAEGFDMEVNEYDAVKQLAETPKAELIKEGYTEKEIQDIKNYETVYKDFFEDMSKVDTDALLAAGYDEEQIQIIKSFDGSQEQIQRASATMHISATPEYFRYDSADRLTKGMLSYSWYWSGVPAFKFKDSVVVGWNGWALFSTSDNQSSTIKYYRINTGAYYGSATGTLFYPSVASNGAGHSFAVSADYDNLYYAKTGTGYFKVKSDVYAQKNFYAKAVYGHAQVSLTPSFSVSHSGITISITLGKNINNVGTSNVSYEF